MELGWNQSFKLQCNEVFGLDIGSSSVKIVQLQKYNGSYAVTAAGIAEIGVSEDSDDAQEINTTRAVRKCLKSAGTSTRLVVCGVSGPEVAVRYFTFPTLPPEEIEGAVLLEAAQVCPFNVDDSTVDYHLIAGDENIATGVLVAATNKPIKTKMKYVQNASLKCVLMDAEGLALLNCFSGFNRNESEKRGTGRVTAVLNVGHSHTTVAIMGDNGLPFIREIAYGGNEIVEQTAVENSISAEDMRLILVGDENPEARPRYGDSFAKACEKLIVDVRETLRYYTTQEKSAVVEKIFVCGGFALAKGLVELLDSQLSAQAVLWDPFSEVRCDAGRHCKDILAKEGPAMAVAAGLAMRSI
jgi:type IV pilus assembly protein PilM